MSLLKCTDIVGSETMVDFQPTIHRVEGAVYVPLGHEMPSGIYDHGRKLVLASGSFRGPEVIPGSARLVMPCDYSEVKSVATDEHYIYGGFVHGHFGHFLLSTLSRFWSRELLADKHLKILCFHHEEIDELFRTPFFSSIFSALEITPDRFVRFREPTIIRLLSVSAVSFEESNFVHKEFGKLGRSIGRSILGYAQSSVRNETPIYLSKAKVGHGVGHIVNEEDLTAVLERHGLAVAYPEQLSFVEQIQTFYDRKIVVGLTGSAMHTSIFGPGCSIVGVSYTNSILSNYNLVDKVCGNDGHYYYSPEGLDLDPPSGAFHLNYRLKDPEKTAGEILRVLDALVARDLYGTDRAEGRRNLALGKATRQSSFGPRELAATEAGRASTATSGILTGRYQFHTDHEPRPWWMVDLGAPVAMDEIRLHNRLDNAQERCARFILSSSDDGVFWMELYRQEHPIIFGGAITEDPFVISVSPPFVTRYLRLQLLATDFLHLDQIEVFGIPASISTGKSYGT